MFAAPRLSLAAACAAALIGASSAAAQSAAAPAVPPAVAPTPPPPPEIEVGRVAPDFTMEWADSSGARSMPVTLSQLRGKVVVLAFYPADRSSGCTHELTKFRDEYAKMFGPGTVRDRLGSIADSQLGTYRVFRPLALRVGVTGLVLLDTRVEALPMEALGADLGDAYVLVREAWTQRRMHQIDDQNADAAGDPDGYSCLASNSKHCRPRP